MWEEGETVRNPKLCVANILTSYFIRNTCTSDYSCNFIIRLCGSNAIQKITQMRVESFSCAKK